MNNEQSEGADKGGATAPAPSRKRSARRWRKVLRALLLVIVAALALILFVADTLLTRNRDALAGWLSDLTGRQVRIEGGIRFRYTPYPTLIAEDIRVRNPAWASRPDTLAARRLSVSIALLPLLARTVELHDASLEGADLLLERGSEGQRNWTLPALASTPGARESGGAWRFVGLETLTLEQIRIGYKPAQAEAFHVELEQAKMTLFADTPLQLHSRGRYRDRPFRLEARGGTFEALLDETGPAFPLEVNFRLGEDALRLSGELARPLGRRLVLQGELAGPDLAALGKLFAREIPARGAYTLAASGVVDPEEVRIEAIRGRLARLGGIDGIAIHAGSLRLPRGQPVLVTLDGEIGALPVSLAFEGGSVRQLIDAGRPWPVTLQARAGDLDLDATGSLDRGGEDFRLDLTLALQADRLEGFDAWLPAPAQRLAPFGFEGRLQAGPGQVRLKTFSLRSGKSDLAGSLTLARQPTVPRLHGKLEARRIDLTPLLPPTAAATSPDAPRQAAADPLQQSLDFVLPTGFDLDLRVAVGEFHGAAYPLRNLQGKVGLQQGVLTLRSVRFEVPGAKVGLTASLNPTEKGLALEAKATSKRVALYTLLSGAGLETPLSGLVRDAEFELAGSGHRAGELLRQSTIRLATGQAVLFLNKADRRHRRKFTLRRLVARSRPDAAVQIQAEGAIEGVGYTARAGTGTLAAVLQNTGRVPLSLEVTLADTRLKVQGDMTLPLRNKRFDFSWRVNGKNLYRLGPVLKTELPVRGEYELAGRIEVRDRELVVPRFTARIEKTRAGGRLAVRREGKRIVVDGHARVNRLSLDMLGGEREEQGKPPVSEEIREAEEVALPIDVLQAMSLTIGIEVDSITRHDNDLGSFRMQATVQDGVVAVEPVVLALHGSDEVTGSFRFDSRARPPSLDVRSSGPRIAYGRLLRGLGISDVAEGDLEFRLQLQGQGTTLRRLIRDTRGHLAIMAGAGRFRNRDLRVTLNMSNVVHAMMPSFFKKEQDVSLHCFVTRWEMQDGKAVTDSTLLQTNRVNVAMVGYVDVIGQQLDLLISPRPIDRTVVDVAVPVRVRGSLANPAITPGALPSLSVLGLVNLDLNYPTDLLGVIKPVDELFRKQADLPADTNRCVAAIAYLKSRAERKSRRPIRELLEDIGRFLGGE